VQVATEALSALRTVQAFNANPQEERKFHDRVTAILGLARKEAIASAVFFGSTGWSGNVTILALLGYGMLHYNYATDCECSYFRVGGTLVSHGEISVGDLTSLLLYTVYVGSGLQMLTCVACVIHMPHAHQLQPGHFL
jgi:putative ABC transport system ATP-binding protein